MAPHTTRYTQPMGYSHLQPNHLQQQQQQHPSQMHGALPPPNLNNPGFGPGSAASNASPFAMAGGMNNGGFSDAGLSSQAAQMGFARGGPVQQQHRDLDGMQSGRLNNGDARIRDVWAHNLHKEFETLRELVTDYPYIAMDTEFPGIVARPIGQFTRKIDYHYQTLRCNVDLLKMIQLGISLFAPDGSVPQQPNQTSNRSLAAHLSNMTQAPITWQFNFKFSLTTDMYAQESTSMLTKAGIDFAQHEKNGIEPFAFGALLISSGMVLEENVHWLSFHSGYDFGYLIKTVINKALPDGEEEFHKLLGLYFPSLYDIKFLLNHAGRKGTINNNQPLSTDATVTLQKIMTKNGLSDIADELQVSRVGTAHQAGSDSLLTGRVYFSTRDKIFGGIIDADKYSGQVWGLNGQIPNAITNRDLSTPNMNGATFYSQNGTPSTPQTGMVGISTHTPVPQGGNGTGRGHMTPGGGYTNYQYQGQAAS